MNDGTFSGREYVSAWLVTGVASAALSVHGVPACRVHRLTGAVPLNESCGVTVLWTVVVGAPNA